MFITFKKQGRAKICDRGYAKSKDFLLWGCDTWKLHGIILDNEQNYRANE